MKDSIEVLVQHPLYGPKSCIAWGVEFIAKLHEGPAMNSTKIQEDHPEGFGFGAEASELLKVYKIKAWQESYEWDEFNLVARDDAAKGFPLVFTMPSSINVDVVNVRFASMGFHACVAAHSPHYPHDPYLTRAHAVDGLIPVSAQALYGFVRNQLLQPNYRVDCLRHRPAATA